jgi:hypothetical protein
MATEAEHNAKAASNQAFLDGIDPAAYPDWAVTVAFYKAVHVVEGLLVRKGHVTRSHTARNQILKRRFRPVWRHYRPLYDLSRTARYWCVPITAANVADARRWLAGVESAVNAVP